MPLQILSKNPERFINKSTSKYDEFIKTVSKEIKSSSEKLSYENIKAPLLVKKALG